MGKARTKPYDRGGQYWREMFSKYKTAKNVAKVVGCSMQTAYKYGHEAGVTFKTGPKRCSKRETALRTYLREHPEDMSMPPSVIAKRAGCSIDSVKSYTYRLRLRSRNVVNSQPWRHTGPPHVLTDVSGVQVPDRAWDVVRAFISRWGSTAFHVTLKTGGRHVFKLNTYELEDTFG